MDEIHSEIRTFNSSRVNKPINYFILFAAISGLVATTFGAFGAHILKNRIAPNMLSIFQTGVQYQFYHSLALLLLALVMFRINNKYLRLSGIFYVLGIILFSGSLYMLSLTNITYFGIITPAGGVAFMLGWVMLAVGMLQQNTKT